jgi:hypothetical protein
VIGSLGGEEGGGRGTPQTQEYAYAYAANGPYSTIHTAPPPKVLGPSETSDYADRRLASFPGLRLITLLFVLSLPDYWRVRWKRLSRRRKVSRVVDTRSAQ